MSRIKTYVRRHHIGLLALFIALGGTAWAADLPPGSVGTSQLQDSAVTGPKLHGNAVSSPKIVDAGVATADLAGGAVTASRLADGAVASAKLADAAATSAKLATNAVTSPKIADGGVANADLATGAVTSPKIADGSVQQADLAPGVGGPPGPTGPAGPAGPDPVKARGTTTLPSGTQFDNQTPCRTFTVGNGAIKAGDIPVMANGPGQNTSLVVSPNQATAANEFTYRVCSTEAFTVVTQSGDVVFRYVVLR